MDDLTTRPQAFLYMKVGNHAGEGFEAILERKRKEREQAERTFWGYGGTACHPLMQVQPFARLYARDQGRIYLLMEPVDSRADPDIEPAKEFSADGTAWVPIPNGIVVTGSRYALVLGEIRPVDIEIPLAEYAVGVGPSRGKNAADYVQGRIDKACLVRAPDNAPAAAASIKKRLKFAAALVEPYAVLLR